MAEPISPPPSNIELIDPIVVPDQAPENQCPDANCTLCALTPQAEQFPSPPAHRHVVQNRKPKKVRTLKIKVDVEIRVPKKASRLG